MKKTGNDHAHREVLPPSKSFSKDSMDAYSEVLVSLPAVYTFLGRGGGSRRVQTSGDVRKYDLREQVRGGNSADTQANQLCETSH